MKKFPVDPNAPRFLAVLDTKPPKNHIKGDPIGRAAFPKSDFKEE